MVGIWKKKPVISQNTKCHFSHDFADNFDTQRFSESFPQKRRLFRSHRRYQKTSKQSKNPLFLHWVKSSAFPLRNCLIKFIVVVFCFDLDNLMNGLCFSEMSMCLCECVHVHTDSVCISLQVLVIGYISVVFKLF